MNLTVPPDHPDAWYLVAASAELRPSSVLARQAGGNGIALYREAAGSPAALSDPCAHMGARLSGGDVVAETLRCPLHHRRYDGRGSCVDPPGGHGQRVHPLVEALGGIFVAAGTVAPSPLNLPETPYRVVAGPPVLIRCPWWTVVANGFDVPHLVTVHGRALLEPAALDAPTPDSLRLRYVARVVGTSGSDRLIRRLSGDRVRVSVTCLGGPLIVVESEAGPEHALLVLGLAQRGEATEVRPLFGVAPRGALDPLRGRLARWLFTRFLTRDLAILEGIRMDPRTARRDPILGACVDFLAARPPAGEAR